ncbi:amine oxidase [Aspergillus sclerotioniger CBS 115572]|uniref:Amine oxidase n=1 Tax=Aspergillus sclerotioniger CBS 115572 TaxID=1450535 RepID=A0A317X8X0_9EURO|nr:amine oxidase [Aspergillus sclerotioniger CBS 115572]PWY94745.1 amine oxidase [Aspergillus sclerotioniger CBS 115572]
MPTPHTKEGLLWTPSTTTEGLSTFSIHPSSPHPQPHYDVIVVGAGFAGLITARDLSQTHRLNVLLLEARDRIGGRTWTANVLGEEIEMGGTWVHWAQPHVYTELHRYGLHRNLKTSAGTVAPETVSFKSSGVVGSMREVLERVAQRVFSIDGLDSRGLMPYPHDPVREAPWKRYDCLSVRDRLDALDDGDVSEWEKELFESNVSTFGSASGREIGFVEALRWYALGGYSMTGVFELAAVFKLGDGGMTGFAGKVLEEFTGDRVYETVVEEIREVGGWNGVEVGTKDGRLWRAKSVVSTIPLNCLGDIKFTPPLPTLQQEAIRNGHINKGAKIHLKLRETLPGWFWTGSGHGNSSFMFAFSDHNGTQPSGPAGTWCIGFGYNGKLVDKRDSRHIVEEFRRNVNPDVHVDAYATHDWMNDPYAKGAWACWGPNAASKYLQALQQHRGRIVFASADWADGWRGFVDGAIEQGHAAVRETVRLLKEQELNLARL